MKMNTRMKALYASLKSTKAEDNSCLDGRLLALLESGFAQANGAVLLKAQQNFAKRATPENFPVLTGYRRKQSVAVSVLSAFGVSGSA